MSDKIFDLRIMKLDSINANTAVDLMLDTLSCDDQSAKASISSWEGFPLFWGARATRPPCHESQLSIMRKEKSWDASNAIIPMRPPGVMDT